MYKYCEGLGLLKLYLCAPLLPFSVLFSTLSPPLFIIHSSCVTTQPPLILTKSSRFLLLQLKAVPGLIAPQYPLPFQHACKVPNQRK